MNNRFFIVVFICIVSIGLLGVMGRVGFEIGQHEGYVEGYKTGIEANDFVQWKKDLAYQRGFEDAIKTEQILSDFLVQLDGIGYSTLYWWESKQRDEAERALNALQKP